MAPIVRFCSLGHIKVNENGLQKEKRAESQKEWEGRKRAVNMLSLLHRHASWCWLELLAQRVEGLLRVATEALPDGKKLRKEEKATVYLL